ncbi:uncharacterized protein TRIADDRAFT_55064 [Trichoplax adhaerens]|uniref:Uncharacterized protein n=1 Tax=Trichoplax adhaerens TaxID=10228 RepID=B3RQP4_TRIAD|nr:predicted protein [Trichoplax adhaerens]EDV26730.1 predicted protein [Trichoplax adhaerens]|eukprot:XP_002110726.1 predicted protein [Trichoplax adhaerens]
MGAVLSRKVQLASDDSWKYTVRNDDDDGGEENKKNNQENYHTISKLLNSTHQTSTVPAMTSNSKAYKELNFDYEYTWPFENLVLEGGGSKGMAYVGTLKQYYQA